MALNLWSQCRRRRSVNTRGDANSLRHRTNWASMAGASMPNVGGPVLLANCPQAETADLCLYVLPLVPPRDLLMARAAMGTGSSTYEVCGN